MIEANLYIISLLFISIFFSILFLQSGLDKIIDFSGNLNYFKTHFENSILKKWTRFLLIIITFLECITGLVFLIAIFFYFVSGLHLIYAHWFMTWGLVLSAITLCCLFLGQRLAKDYAGAATLISYFLVNLLGFIALGWVEFNL
jgi:hypothetical protein